MRLVRALALVLTLTACDLLGGGAPDRFVGVLAGPGVTGVLEIGIPKGKVTLSGLRLAPALPTGASGQSVAVIHLSTGNIELTGTFDPATGGLVLAGTSSDGGSWSLSGTFANDAFSGGYTSPGGSGTFVAAHAPGTTGTGELKLYCGTHSGDSTGVWNLIVADGGAAFGVHCSSNDCGRLTGTISGTTMTLNDPDEAGAGATGTTDGTNASGTWTNGNGKSGTWEGTTASCEAIVAASEDPAPVEFPKPIAMQLTNPFDLAIDATHVYTFHDSKVVRCPIDGCGNDAPELVANATSFPSSLAIDNGTLYVGHDFRRISSCSVSVLPCTLAEFVDVGESTYPSHLTVHAGHVYWLKESGGDRTVQACPVAGCGSGPVNVVSAPALLSGVAVSGIAVGDDALHVQAYFGALYAFTLTSATASSGTGSLVVETGGASGGLNRVGDTLLFAQPDAKKFRKCTLPACSDASDVAGYEAASTPAGITANATHYFLLNRGNATGNTFDAGTGMIMRAKR